jgi:hypothetical protein
MEGKKFDSGKPRISLLSSAAILEVAKVATMGAEKYDDHNWRKGMKWSRLMDAAERHLLDYNNGDRIDKESKLSHLAHVAWNIMALIEYEISKVGEDDLFKGYEKTKENKLSFFIPNGTNLVDAINDGTACVIQSDLITGTEDDYE